MATATSRLLLGCSWLRSPTDLKQPSVSVFESSIPLRSMDLNPHYSQLTSSSRGKQLKHVVVCAAAMHQPPLDLTEENVKNVLVEARVELAQIFDTSVGMTGQAELADVDGPFVKIRLKGRFWHKRTTVLARLENFMKNRIPEILEVDIEDEKQLDDSPQNF